MSTTREHTTPLSTAWRWAFKGFVIGVAIALPATVFAWVSPVGEILHPVLVPDFEAFHPLSRLYATWPGLGPFSLAFLLNGVIYAVVGGGLGAMRGWQRAGDSRCADTLQPASGSLTG